MILLPKYSLAETPAELEGFSSFRLPQDNTFWFSCIWQCWLASIKCLSSVSYCFNQCVCVCVFVWGACIGMCPLTRAIKHRLYFQLWEPIKSVFFSQNSWKQIKANVDEICCCLQLGVIPAQAVGKHCLPKYDRGDVNFVNSAGMQHGVPCPAAHTCARSHKRTTALK